MLNIKKNDDFYLLGHSMGGYAIKAYLSEKNYPKPRAIFFNNTSAGGKLRVKSSTEIQNILLNLDQNSKEYIKLMTGNDIEYSELVKTFLSSKSITISSEQAKFQENLIYDYFNNEQLCTQIINIPTCIIHGKNDLVFPIQNAHNLLNLCENYASLNLTLGSHNHFYDYHKYISNIITNFVDNLYLNNPI